MDLVMLIKIVEEVERLKIVVVLVNFIDLNLYDYGDVFVLD